MRSPRSRTTLTRREALLALGGLGVVACGEGRRSREAPRPGRLAAEQRPALAAAADRVFPGAAAAGALDFFDRLFAEPAYLGVRQQFELAGQVLDAAARARHRHPYAECTPAEQDALLRAARRGELPARGFDGDLFVKRLTILTVESFLGDPKHGGNRDQIGWRLIGRHACHFTPRRLELVTKPGSGLPY
jgi:hypothetical protein